VQPAMQNLRKIRRSGNKNHSFAQSLGKRLLRNRLSTSSHFTTSKTRPKFVAAESDIQVVGMFPYINSKKLAQSRERGNPDWCGVNDEGPNTALA
jgi:hypothetical protein